MARSLRGRLVLLVALLAAAMAAAGVVMTGLFQQSAAAQIGQARAELGRSCDAITDAYGFYSAGWSGPQQGLADPGLRRDLTAVVRTALRDRLGVEGGIWQGDAGSLAYAFPTYDGAAAKTDLPEAELPRIQAINAAVIAEDRAQASRSDAGSQSLLLAACPLPGPISGLTGWTMIRVYSLAGGSYERLMLGLGILLLAIVAATLLSLQLAMRWSSHVGQIEKALNAHDLAELPVIRETGERELDRIILALNEAGRRLGEEQRRGALLSRQVATGERLAAIGRLAAGVAHEIRNPIAAMRLKAENAQAAGPQRQGQALSFLLQQIDRLDRLLERLFNVTEPEEPRAERVALNPFLADCVGAYVDLASAKGVRIEIDCALDEARFDATQMRRALDNLVLNAIQFAPADSVVQVGVRRAGDALVLSVRDRGAGPPPDIAAHLFEPFVTGRADGTGLGLPIVRQVAQTHGGDARFMVDEAGTVFEIAVPWQTY